MSTARCSARGASASAATLAALCVLASCGSSVDPLAPSEAEAHYRAVATDVIAALEPVAADGASWDPGGTTLQPPDPGACTYRAGRWEADGWESGPVFPADGADMWAAVRDSVDPVLEQHGFEPLGEPEQQGGLAALSTEDSHGATLSIDDRGTLEISGAALEGENC